MIGSTLSQYRITAKLGAGGMGEVYKAHDTKLGRDVAIKVLPEALSQDKERLARFGREAKLLAALNHPNIATLHGLEEFGGTRFLVMELIEGEILAERISKGPIPVGETLPLLAQVAEALEAAHQKGIIHRDLKPANIKVTSEGRVKVLDFIAAPKGAKDPSEARLYLRSIDRNVGESIRGTEGASQPFFSPDSRWIGFFANGKLKKVPITGGGVSVLCDAVFPWGGSWARFCPTAPLLAYHSNETGRQEVWVRPYPSSPEDTAIFVSTDAGRSPFWSQDGRELFYRSHSKLMLFRWSTNRSFVSVRPVSSSMS